MAKEHDEKKTEQRHSDNLQLKAFEVSLETEQRPVNPEIAGLGQKRPPTSQKQ